MFIQFVFLLLASVCGLVGAGENPDNQNDGSTKVTFTGMTSTEVHFIDLNSDQPQSVRLSNGEVVHFEKGKPIKGSHFCDIEGHFLNDLYKICEFGDLLKVFDFRHFTIATKEGIAICPTTAVPEMNLECAVKTNRKIGFCDDPDSFASSNPDSLSFSYKSLLEVTKDKFTFTTVDELSDEEFGNELFRDLKRIIKDADYAIVKEYAYIDSDLRIFNAYLINNNINGYAMILDNLTNDELQELITKAQELGFRRREYEDLTFKSTVQPESPCSEISDKEESIHSDDPE